MEGKVRGHASKPAPESLIGILLASLEALAVAGQVDAACRLAGRACVALRHSDPQGEHRFNALLHRMAPRVPRSTQMNNDRENP
ncbi:MAG: hypothetical protein EPN74_17025 [Rhodanobacter sp.]|nr:MAG: hypothetical protein EPN74_17025 [Rhodanobacter sp.]